MKYIDGGDIDLDHEKVTTLDGTRITEAVAERMANEAERSGPAVGRPSLSKAGKSPQVAVRLPGELYERLIEASADRGETPSEFMREALMHELDRV